MGGCGAEYNFWKFSANLLLGISLMCNKLRVCGIETKQLEFQLIFSAWIAIWNVQRF